MNTAVKKKKKHKIGTLIFVKIIVSLLFRWHKFKLTSSVNAENEVRQISKGQCL